jgi:hypothetical protein
MKSRSTTSHRPFVLKLLHYGNCYYIRRIAKLEKAISRRPRTLRIEMIGGGEISPDAALLMRSILLKRSPRTRLITEARSTLQNSAVLVWLLGDVRLIRDDARVCFRRANLPEPEKADQEDAWKDEICDSEVEPEEGDYARVLELINEFLPVKELAGRLVEIPVLRQFGLVENEKVDHFLATVFQRETVSPEAAAVTPGQAGASKRSKVLRARPPGKQQR